MRKIEQATTSGVDITRAVQVHSYQADNPRLVLIRLFIDGVVGGGDYTAYVTVQPVGTGNAYHIVPLTITPVDSAYAAICLSSVTIPLDSDDIIKAYVIGGIFFGCMIVLDLR